MPRVRTRKTQRWTEQRDALMMRLFEVRADDEEFRRTLGVSKQAAYTHKAYIKRIDKYGSTSHRSNNSVRSDTKIDQVAVAAAKRRAIADRPITAWLLGDPAPGYHEDRARIERQARIARDEQRAKTADAQKEKTSPTT